MLAMSASEVQVTTLREEGIGGDWWWRREV